MYKIGICGHFGGEKTFLDGQTIKTKTVADELINIFGSKLIRTVDTYKWKYNPVTLIYKAIMLVKKSENIVVLPARNGVKILIPLFLLLNKIYKHQLHYIVIGGWLPELLEGNTKLISRIALYNGVYVETTSMLKKLNNLGLKNVIVMPNFKQLNILKENELVYPKEKPYKLCTFSRVSKEKGIEDAINSVIAVNNFFGQTIFSLDIYGQPDVDYIVTFEEMIRNFPDYIKYKGMVEQKNSVEVIKNYMALLFPTFYPGEGFAGTILDAYASGVPVIASDWKYNKEIIMDRYNGFIFKTHNTEQLHNILIDIGKNPENIIRLKKNCLKEASNFMPNKVINCLVMNLR